MAYRPDALVRNRIAIAAIFMINGIVTGIWAVHIPSVAAIHAIGPFVLGLVLLTIAAGAIAAMPLAGYAAGRFGADRATCFFVAAFLAVMALPLLAPDLPLLFAAAFVYGVFNGGLDVTMNAQAADIERARLRPTMSSFHGFWSVGGLAGAAVGGMLIGAGFGGGTIMLGAAAFFAVVVACLWSWILPLPDPERHPAERRFAVPTRAVWLLGLFAMLGMVVEGACADWSALHLVENTHATPAVAAAGFAAMALTMAASRFAGDTVIEKLGRIAVMRAGGLLIALGFLIAVFVPVPLLAAAGFGLVGLGAANMVPVMIGEASRLPGVAPGAGVAAVTGIGYFGFLAGPPLIGLLAKGIGLGNALASLALVGLLLTAASAAVIRSR